MDKSYPTLHILCSHSATLWKGNICSHTLWRPQKLPFHHRMQITHKRHNCTRAGNWIGLVGYLMGKECWIRWLLCFSGVRGPFNYVLIKEIPKMHNLQALGSLIKEFHHPCCRDLMFSCCARMSPFYPTDAMTGKSLLTLQSDWFIFMSLSIGKVWVPDAIRKIGDLFGIVFQD